MIGTGKQSVTNMSGNNLDENWIRPGIFSGLFLNKKKTIFKKELI